MIRRHLVDICLISVPALLTTALNFYAYVVPYLAEITIIVLGICLVTLGYRYGASAYAHQKNASLLMRYFYTGLIASITVFAAAQIIRLIAGILYGLTFITDPDALALQAHYVLPSFVEGTLISLPFIVGVSFALGFIVVLPIVLFIASKKK